MQPADLIRWRAPGAFPFGAARLRINWANPLTKGLVGLWTLGRGGAPRNLVTGEAATAFNTPLHGSGVVGPAWAGGGTQQGWEVKNGTLISGRSEWTIATVVAIPSGATTSSSGRALYCERASSGNDITKLDFGPNNTSNLGVVWRNTAGNLINPSPSGDSRNSRRSVFAASLSWAPNTTTIRNYINGGLSRTDTVGASNVTQSNASKRSTIGYDFAASAATNLIGDVSLVAVFEPQWSAEQHALFAYDPWALLVEQAPIIIGRRSAGGPSAVTLSGGATSPVPTGAGALAAVITLSGGATSPAPTGAGNLGVAVTLSGGATAPGPTGAGDLAAVVTLGGSGTGAAPTGAGDLTVEQPEATLSGGATSPAPTGAGSLVTLFGGAADDDHYLDRLKAALERRRAALTPPPAPKSPPIAEAPIAAPEPPARPQGRPGALAALAEIAREPLPPRQTRARPAPVAIEDDEDEELMLLV